MWIIIAWLCISPEVTVQGFKKCHISTAMRLLVICCGMALKRIGVLEVRVRKMMALIVKMEIVTLIGKGV
jgi:hypothetical protein